MQQREKLVFLGMVDLLRGLEHGIAVDNSFSTFQRAAFRFRLSRFDIGPSQQRS
jgi:hypothetical protein